MPSTLDFGQVIARHEGLIAAILGKKDVRHSAPHQFIGQVGAAITSLSRRALYWTEQQALERACRSLSGALLLPDDRQERAALLAEASAHLDGIDAKKWL